MRDYKNVALDNIEGAGAVIYRGVVCRVCPVLFG